MRLAARSRTLRSARRASRWAEFTAWLDERTATTVRENFVMAHTRSMALADRVAEVFADQGSKIGLLAFCIDNADTVLQPVTTLDSLENGKRATPA